MGARAPCTKSLEPGWNSVHSRAELVGARGFDEPILKGGVSRAIRTETAGSENLWQWGATQNHAASWWLGTWWAPIWGEVVAMNGDPLAFEIMKFVVAGAGRDC
jgi:hypothetical protein